MKIKTIIIFLVFLAVSTTQTATTIPWKVIELMPKSRIDAIADLGHGTILVGTRNTTPAQFFKSTDYGLSWKKLSSLESTEKHSGITCIQSGGNGICYALNESSEFFKSVDSGESWQRITKLSTGINTEGHAISYGICVTKKGTLLVSDANSTGGAIYRSTDKGISFLKLPQCSPKGLYRFTLMRNCILINGWQGSVYCSKDDGLTWKELAKLEQAPLYAPESLGGNIYLQGAETGNIYRGNTRDKTFQLLAKPGGAADDFVYAGYGTILYSTYTESQHVFISHDMGNSWSDEGIVPTGQVKDWLDHIIKVEKKDSVVIIGGTNKGFILRTSYAKKELQLKQLK